MLLQKKQQLNQIKANQKKAFTQRLFCCRLLKPFSKGFIFWRMRPKKGGIKNAKV